MLQLWERDNKYFIKLEAEQEGIYITAVNEKGHHVANLLRLSDNIYLIENVPKDVADELGLRLDSKGRIIIADLYDIVHDSDKDFFEVLTKK